MKTFGVFMMAALILAACAGGKGSAAETERYFATYEKIVRFTYDNIEKEEGVVKEGVDKILKDAGYTMESYQETGKKLLDRDKETFIRKIDEINRQFAREKQ